VVTSRWFRFIFLIYLFMVIFCLCFCNLQEVIFHFLSLSSTDKCSSRAECRRSFGNSYACCRGNLSASSDYQISTFITLTYSRQTPVVFGFSVAMREDYWLFGSTWFKFHFLDFFLYLPAMDSDLIIYCLVARTES
jgi:hypothetical protein